jgi:hypothetical protein
VPVYDFARHQRSTEEWRRVPPADVIIIEVRRRPAGRPGALAPGATCGRGARDWWPLTLAPRHGAA